MNEKLKTGKSFGGVILLNALLAYPIVYLIYKHFNPALTPMDVNSYMTMVAQGPGSIEPPFHYRWLLPFLIRFVRFLPGYDIPIVFSLDPVVKRDFFHFLVLNFCMTVLTSGVIFLYLRDKLRPGFAYLGSLLYLFAFYPVLLGLIPMTDAICHLAIISCILLIERERPLWFAFACLIGVFAKETLLIVLPLWIILQSFSNRRRLSYLICLLPAALAYFIVTHQHPVESSFQYYHPSFLLRNMFNAFLPDRYDRSLLFHIFLSQLPLMACGLVFLHLKVVRKVEALKLNPELFLFFFLLWMGITMGIGNNSGRIAFMAFPAIIYFEAMVIQAVVIY